MNLLYYAKHPFTAFRMSFYFFVGNTLGRLCYPKNVFSSKYFQSPGGCGWMWITRCLFTQKISGINRHVPWPCSSRILVACPNNIEFCMDDLNNFMTIGNYFQAIGRLHIGKGTYIAPNVGLITENHDLIDPDRRAGAKEIVIGEKCWIGMNAMILPGVTLGEHVVVGAGSVVTKSFPEGFCVIAGNPAKILRYIDLEEV